MNRRTFLASTLASSALCAIRPGTSAIAEALLPAPPDEQLPPALQRKLASDPFRPQFHLLPMANWMNDPCAPRFYRGQYHMFFQYNPGGPVWGDMHWAHAVSPDLIHWKHLPYALAPTAGSYDSYGCFTGSVLPGAEVATILYTGVTKCPPEQETIRGEGTREVQCLATSTDPDLKTWVKRSKPVIDTPPPGVKVTGFRDPCPWKDGDTWYLIVGSGFNKVGGCVLLYRSTDARHWEYLHPLAQGKWNGGSMTNPVDTGEMWECPDFFPLGNKHALLYSTERKVYWEVGTFDKKELRFHTETRGLLDHGYYYAMKSMLDEKGRRILWGWVEESRSAEECTAAGWAGSMALPRVLTLGADNQLHMAVPPEFTSLRQKTHELHAPRSSSALDSALATMPIQNRAAEIIYSFKASDVPAALELRTGNSPMCAIKYDGVKSKPSVTIGDKTIALNPDHAGISTVQLWIDGSIIEVFIDGKEAMTARDFTPSSGDIHPAWTGPADSLRSISVSAITPISHDRLTT